MAPPNLSEQLRANLLRCADQDQARQLARELSDLVNDRLNQSGVLIGTSLFARALLARAVMSVAAAWWADACKAPEPETWAAIRSVIDDLPASVTPHVYTDPKIVTGERHR